MNICNEDVMHQIGNTDGGNAQWIEFAIKADTVSWAAVGFRPFAVTGGNAPNTDANEGN